MNPVKLKHSQCDVCKCVGQMYATHGQLECLVCGNLVDTLIPYMDDPIQRKLIPLPKLKCGFWLEFQEFKDSELQLIDDIDGMCYPDQTKKGYVLDYQPYDGGPKHIGYTIYYWHIGEGHYDLKHAYYAVLLYIDHRGEIKEYYNTTKSKWRPNYKTKHPQQTGVFLDHAAPQSAKLWRLNHVRV